MTIGRQVAGAALAAWLAMPAIASGGEGGVDAGALIQPKYGTLFWTAVTFVLLAFLLSKVAWKPLLGAIQERERSIEESLEQARREREDAEKLLGEHRALVAQAQRERAEAVEKGRVEAERLKTEILQEARTQSEHRLQKAEEQVQAELRQARDDLREMTVDLAIQAAGKLLTRNLDDSTQRKLVEDHLSDLEKRSQGSTGLPS